MDKKLINFNNLEKFLEKAKNKINDGVENIGVENMTKLDDILNHIRQEKNKNEEFIVKIIEGNSENLPSFLDVEKINNKSLEFLYGKSISSSGLLGKLCDLCNITATLFCFKNSSMRYDEEPPTITILETLFFLQIVIASVISLGSFACT